MPSPLVPVLVLLVLPALYLSHRLGRPKSRWLRWLGGAALAAAVVASLPYEGVDLVHLKRLTVLLCLAMALILTARHLGRLSERSFMGVLAVMATAAVAVYLNFFAFHGARTWVQLHDVAHYYLGSKYYAELGYHDLYTAMLRAEAELYDNHFKTVTARDLTTYEEVHIAQLLRRSDPVKAKFSDERWQGFQRDVAYFREALGPHYAAVLVDHGFNPTPVWALIGGALSGLVPDGSGHGVFALALVDAALLTALFAAVGWAFGLRTLLLALTYFCVIFGANFSWTGGAFLRYLWLFGLGVGVCCLHRRRDAAAGALFALAALLRVFPAMFAVPIVLKGLAHLWRRRALPRRQAVFAGSFAATAVVLVAATGLLPRGFDHWREFRDQMERYVANISPNIVGLTEILAYQEGERMVTQEELDALKARRQRIHNWQLVLIFLPALVAAARLSRFMSDLGAVALALPLLLLSLNLGSYYQVFLVVLVLWQRSSPRNLALIFAVEAASYGLVLFEEREALTFLYRSALLLFLYAALLLPALRRELAPNSTRAGRRTRSCR